MDDRRWRNEVSSFLRLLAEYWPADSRHGDLQVKIALENHADAATKLLHRIDGEDAPLEPDNLKWSCMVCGVIRPDAMIRVYTKDVSDQCDPALPAGSVLVNIRYCRDQPSCGFGASSHELTRLFQSDQGVAHQQV